MSVCRIEWSQISDLEDDIRHVARMGDVLTTIGTGNEMLSRDGCYLLGCMLHDMGRRLEERFDAIQPVKTEGGR